MRIKYPCTVCGRSVAKNHKALQCDYCDQWVHIKCNLIDKKAYELFKQDGSPWSCIKCTENIFPFIQADPPANNHNHLTAKQQEIINALHQITDDPEKGNPSLINISLPSYNIECTDTESASRGTLLYISKSLNYINRQDLNLYKTEELETTFIEVFLPKRKGNLVVGTIYCHPCMDPDEFNTQYLPKLLSNISKEIKQKDFVLMGDFNIDLLNYTSDNKVAEFLDKMYSSSLLPLITHPTRISKTSQTLIDNIFSTIISDESKTGNITTVISDHFCQFVSLSLAENTDNKKSQFGRNFSNFGKEHFSQDIKHVNWENILEIEKGDPNLSLEKYLTKMNSILDKHLSLKKLSK